MKFLNDIIQLSYNSLLDVVVELLLEDDVGLTTSGTFNFPAS